MKTMLKTTRLLLRPLTTGDLHTAFAYNGDAQATRYMLNLPHKTLEEEAAFISGVEAEWRKESPTIYEFAVTLGGTHIGGVSIEPDEKRESGELGWIIGREYQGRGYALEAASALIDFCGRELRLVKVFARCDAQNEPSYLLMERLGLAFECEGTRLYHDERGQAREFTYSKIVRPRR